MGSKRLLHDYWRYYIELEKQVCRTRRYVSFESANYSTYSVEYIQLLQAICSEIDVVGKIIAQFSNPDFKVDRKTNINKWGFEVQTAFNGIDSKTIYFDDRVEITPFKKWKYQKKDGRKITLAEGAQNPFWWTSYNSVKHGRTSIDENDIVNYKKANLKSVIYSLGALYILEYFLLSTYGGVNLTEHQASSVCKSTIFMWSIEEVVSANKVFALV